MTVGAISNSAVLDPSQVDPSSWQTRMQQAMEPVASLFGESSQQLTSQLQSGQTSLSSLAQSKGISQSDLMGAIQQGLQQSSANGGPPLSSTQLTNISGNVANRVHHHHHHGGGMGAMGGAGSSDAASSDPTAADPTFDPTAAAAAALGLTDPSSTSDTDLSSLTDPSGAAAAVLGITDPDSTSDGSLSSPGSTSALQTDAQRLMFELQSMQAASPSTASPTAAGATSAFSSASMTNLLTQLTQFDQTL